MYAIRSYYGDDCIAFQGDLDFDILRQHYLHELPWHEKLSEGDLAFLAKDGGSLKFLSPVDYYAPVSGEDSTGTSHEVKYRNNFV